MIRGFKHQGVERFFHKSDGLLGGAEHTPSASNSILIFALRSISVFPGIICTKDCKLHTAEPHERIQQCQEQRKHGVKK
jgi:hypothetical protein